MEHHKSKFVRATIKGDATLVLAAIGAIDTISVILKVAQYKKDFKIQRQAIEALGTMGSATPEVVDALIEFLGHKYGVLREEAARSLAKLGPSAKKALPKLTEKMNKDNSQTAIESARAIGRINK